MPTTDRNAIRYPAPGDPPDGPGAMERLAKDVDVLLNRAIACTSATRPGTPLTGMLIYESDTGLVLLYRSGAWRIIGHSNEIETGMRSRPAASQSITAGQQVALAYANDGRTTPLVTKAQAGTGHGFTLNRAGRWAFTATQRVNGGGVADVYLWLTENSFALSEDSNTNNGRGCTRHVAYTGRFPAGTQMGVWLLSTVGLTTAGDLGGSGFTAEWLGP